MARSHRTTPSAQTSVPGRVGRVRSGTQEAAPVPAATQLATTTSMRSTRAKSVESNASIGSRASRTRRGTDAPKEIQAIDLTMVEEGLDDEDGDLEIPPPDEVPDARAARVEDEAVGDRSLHSMSGTTARDLQSQDSDDYELNPHLLLAYAPAAYQAAVNLVKRFDQHKPVLLQILKGIDRPDSSNATGFQQDIEALNDAMLQLGEDFQNSLVSADHVMETLFKQSLPHMTSKCWRVTELIQLLNLAVIVREVAGGSAETDKMAIKLYMLDAQFPSPFLQNINMLEDSPYIVGNSFLREETFEAALAIRLQSTVLQIHRSFGSEDFDPDKLIQEMFFALPGKAESLRAWDINGLGSGDLGLLPEFDAKMRRWIRRLIGAVKDDEEEIGDGSEEGMQILARNFPWTDFRATVLRWAKLRMEEIRSSIEDSGGIKKLMQQVRAELSKDARFDPEAAIPSPRSPAKKKAKHASTRSGARQTSVTRPTLSPLRSTHGNTVRHRLSQADDDFQPIEETEVAQDDELVAVVSKFTENQRQQKENLRRQPTTIASPARRRGFVDPQEYAERITDFNTQSTPSQEYRPQNSARPNPAKRKQPQTEDVTDDEGFEDDSREIDMSQRRREAPRPEPSPSKRVRIQEPGRGAPRYAGSQEDPRVREYAEQKRIMNSQAARAVRSSPRRPRFQLGRTRWGAAEELRLEELISAHGISWAYLKAIDKEGDNLFEGRDQVALKDKARNMKTQMLLNGVDPLPRNWEYVPLDKKAVNRLVKGNIDEARLERAGVQLHR